MCGKKLNWRFLALVACFSLCWGSLQAADSVTIPMATWEDITLRVKLLGGQLDELTQKSSELEKSLMVEREASARASKLRDERIMSLSNSLQKSTKESKLKGSILVGETVALVIFAGAAVFFAAR